MLDKITKKEFDKIVEELAISFKESYYKDWVSTSLLKVLVNKRLFGKK